MLKTLLILCMLATAGILITGLFSLFKPGKKGKSTSNKLMVWRVWMQGAALIIFAIILYSKGK